MLKIFVTRPIPDSGIKLLQAKGYEVVVNAGVRERVATREEVLAGVRGADALLSVLTEKIDAEVMDAGAPTLKIIANYAVGFDNIDLAAAKQRNIMVTNTPGVLTNTVAEHTFALLFGMTPNSGLVPDDVKKDQFGQIMVNANCETNIAGLYAAGDVTDVSHKQIVIAAGMGTCALLSAVNYLNRLK